MLTQFLCNFALCKRARTGCASALQRHTLLAENYMEIIC